MLLLVLANPRQQRIRTKFVAVDLVQIRKLAEQREDENFRFRRFLKTECNLEPNKLDQRVFETTRRVWAGIDCTTCAHCCRELTPTFSEEEVDRVAHRLGMQRQEFIQAYLKRSDDDSDNPWQTRSTPCPFLKDNLCSIYEDRPDDCSAYPYLYKPSFATRTLGMVERTFTCPIVYEVMEDLKKSLGFPRKTKSGMTGEVRNPRR
jgi:Fe-S-cluster containining protein